MKERYLQTPSAYNQKKDSVECDGRNSIKVEEVRNSLMRYCEGSGFDMSRNPTFNPGKAEQLLNFLELSRSECELDPIFYNLIYAMLVNRYSLSIRDWRKLVETVAGKVLGDEWI